MNYELAKELKDAGFTYSQTLHWTIFPGGLPGSRVMSREPLNEGILEPALSELIEACGKDFGKLVFEQKSKFEMKWHSYDCLMGEGHDMRGSTPEEAVAMLYLALHGKGKTRPPVEG